MSDLSKQLEAAMNKLAKWRSVFTGWQLGTRSLEDAEAQAVRDHREVTLMLRAEVNALTRILFTNKLAEHEEFQRILLEEVEYLDKAYEKKFPGFTTTDSGMKVDVKVAAETTKGWRP